MVFSSLFLTVQESKCVIRTEGAEFTSRLRFKSRDSDDVVLDVVDVHIVVILRERRRGKRRRKVRYVT